MRVVAVAALLLGLCAVAVQSRAVCQTAVVQPGDSVTQIEQRYNIRPGTLDATLVKCELTPGYQPGGILVANQRICLPGWVSACLNVANSDTSGDQTCMYYTVQGGDTMATIGQYFSIPQMEVEDANPGLDPARLSVNSYVKLPDWADSCPEPGVRTACRVYVAESSDSLSLIATAFAVDLAELQALNSNTDAGAVLLPGQKIFLPPFDKAACGAGVVVPKPSACKAYQVQASDTLFTIATQFQTTVSALTLSNPQLAAGGPLSPGTQVLLPPATPECVNPEFVTGTPLPPSPPTPPSPPVVETPALVETPPMVEPPMAEPPVASEPVQPDDAEAPGPAPALAPSPAVAPVPAPMPSPADAPTPAPAPAPTPAPAPSSAASGPAANLVLAVLALVGAIAALL